ncbi:PP2C family protein-serine/threonine phosphatase [Derxia lacustris]|uniref:PP2C family protein-serine/threonine phosphatase n=1 Tax=Derxia lacustris TaxID=764842 RepID=UPI000A17223C|nr:protein phosphatase 2C domain-containing protein [Derxia lacustris]
MRFSIYQESKRGGRKVNQDRMGYCYTRDTLLLVVCDGMGGHLNGEIAAQIAVQTIGALFQRDARPMLKDPRQFLEDAMLTAHIEIHRYRAGRGLPESPRTTAVACIVQRGVAYWAHAGDSRLYHIRDGLIQQVTRDHSQLEAMIQDGLLDQRDRADYPERNRLFNCLGAPAMPLVELADPVKLVPGDHLLLCSDGLWGAVPDTIIASAFRSNSVMRVVPELINYALMQAGARADNVSAVGMTWESDSSPEEDRGAITPGRTADAFTSTIQFPPQGKPTGDHALTDDDIESAIADIRKAIAATHKSPPPKR